MLLGYLLTKTGVLRYGDAAVDSLTSIRACDVTEARQG
jgi:hypothetical protein